MRKKASVRTRYLTLALLTTGLLGAGCRELLMGYSEPEWTSVVKYSDGRSFVTDGNLALEVTFAEPKEIPSATSPAWFDGALRSHGQAEKQELFASTDLRASDNDDSVLTAPGGLTLDKDHINYLRGKFGNVSFWQFRRMEPVVIVIGGKQAGALKPVSQP